MASSAGALAEADAVLLHALRQLNLHDDDRPEKEEDDDEVGGSAGLASVDLLQVACRWLRMVKDSGGGDTEQRVPSNPSARFQLASRLASELTEMGYRDEANNAAVGFAAFLYPNEASTRAILGFMLERVSAAAGAAAAGGVDERDVDDGGGRGAGRGSKRSHGDERQIRAAVYASLKKVRQRGRQTERPPAPLPFWSCGPCKSTGAKGSTDRETEALGLLLARAALGTRRGSGAAASTPAALTLVPSANRLTSLRLARASTTENRQRAPRTGVAQDARAAELREAAAAAARRQLRGASGSAQRKLVSTDGLRRSPSGPGGGGLFASMTMFDEADVASSRQEQAALSSPTADGAAATVAVIETAEMKMAKRQEELRSLQGELSSIAEGIHGKNDEIASIERMCSAAAELQKKFREDEAGVRADIEALKDTFGITSDENDTEAISLSACRETLLQRRRDIEKRYAKLQSKFEAAAAPLLEEIGEQTAVADAKRASSADRLAQLHSLRRDVKETLAVARAREAEKYSLMEDIDRLRTDEPTRESYVLRILEIIKNVKKQETEITRIIEDTKEVQRSMNNLVGVLKRSHAITDDVIFRDASSARGGEDAKKAYRISVEIHKSFQALGSISSERGRLAREEHGLEARVADMEANVNDETLKQVMDELQRVRLENEQSMRK